MFQTPQAPGNHEHVESGLGGSGEPPRGTVNWEPVQSLLSPPSPSVYEGAAQGHPH
jgi:hypothetical protein